MDSSFQILPLIGAFAAIIGVLYLCYLFSRFLAKKVNNVSKSNNIVIHERVSITQDKGLLIAEISHKYYLIAFSNNSIEILKELDGAELQLQKPAMTQNFLDILNSTIKRRTDLKTSDKSEKNDKYFE